jgi:hypothetical protein
MRRTEDIVGRVAIVSIKRMELDCPVGMDVTPVGGKGTNEHQPAKENANKQASGSNYNSCFGDQSRGTATGWQASCYMTPESVKSK